MLFNLKPKESQSELFGRGEELDKFAGVLSAGNWATVLGPRMVGKTSLIKVALSEMKHRKTLYVDFLGVSSLGGATKAIIEQVNKQKGFWQKLGEKIAGTDSFMVSKEGVSWSGKGAPSQTLRRVLAGLADKKNPTVVVFDEVQEIYPATAQLIKVLKNVWDTEGGGILFVFSGSKFGFALW